MSINIARLLRITLALALFIGVAGQPAQATHPSEIAVPPPRNFVKAKSTCC